jgi:hypothetical protein
MFTIQYIDIAGHTVTQNFDGRDRGSLARHLSRFSRPILNIYEQATPITNTMRKELRTSKDLSLGVYARNFAFSA